jgi:hypothetical protein
MNNPLIGRFYRHYKGGLYTVIDIAQHTERGHEVLVVYRHTSGAVYARPLESWLKQASVNETDGGLDLVDRFELLPHDFKM